MNDALDYVIELSEDSSSAFYNKVDTAKLGSTGYSLGGMGAMRVAANSRIGATFIWDSRGDATSIHGPLGGIFAGDGDWDSTVEMINSSAHPAFGMRVAGTDHTTVTYYPMGETPYSQRAYVAWFRWHFMGDPAARAMFAGDSCGFCTIADIDAIQKNSID